MPCRLGLATAVIFVATQFAGAVVGELPLDGPAVVVQCDRAGATDVTAAIQAAINSTWSAWEQVYLPAGTYLISNRIVIGKFITLRGDGPGRTIVKLRDASPGFTDANTPRGIVAICEEGNCDGGGHNNTTHSAFIFNMTIDAGRNNPGAIGIDFIAHNGGGIENVRLTAPPSSGHTAIWMMREATGPALVRDVEIEGFAYGVKIRWGVYGMTFENITFRSQRTVAFDNSYHPVALRKITSVNSVPFYHGVTDNYGMLVLLDATLTGGAAGSAAIETRGSAYVRNVLSDGYSATLDDNGKRVSGTITEYTSCPILQTVASPNRSLMLAIKDPPAAQLDPVGQWVNVYNVGSGSDWAPRIQAAIDGGARTLYFKNFTHAVYAGSGTVVVRGAVRSFIGMYARLTGIKVVCEVDDPSAVVYFEQMRFDEGFEHRGRATVVLNRCMGSSLRVVEGAGDVFVDDWCCGNIVVGRGCSVWSRQLNEESLEPVKLDVSGGSLWVLGLKTEQFGTVGRVQRGGALEILGCLLYPSQGRGDIAYVNDNSALAVFHREMGAGYTTFAREIHGTTSVDVNPPFTQGTFYVSNPQGIGGGSSTVSVQRRTGIGGIRCPATIHPSVAYGPDGRRTVKGWGVIVVPMVHGKLKVILSGTKGKH